LGESFGFRPGLSLGKKHVRTPQSRFQVAIPRVKGGFKKKWKRRGREQKVLFFRQAGFSREFREGLGRSCVMRGGSKTWKKEEDLGRRGGVCCSTSLGAAMKREGWDHSILFVIEGLNRAKRKAGRKKKKVPIRSRGNAV